LPSRSFIDAGNLTSTPPSGTSELIREEAAYMRRHVGNYSYMIVYQQAGMKINEAISTLRRLRL